VWNTEIEETYCIRRGITLALIRALKETDWMRDVVLFPHFLREIKRWNKHIEIDVVPL
jgi:hypothetical protein